MDCIIEDDWILMLTRWKRSITRDKAKEGIIFNLSWGVESKRETFVFEKIAKKYRGKE